jgi:hypothetical protein
MDARTASVFSFLNGFLDECTGKSLDKTNKRISGFVGPRARIELQILLFFVFHVLFFHKMFSWIVDVTAPDFHLEASRLILHAGYSRSVGYLNDQLIISEKRFHFNAFFCPAACC